MNFNDICINCFKPHGGEEVCMNCGHIQTDKPKQLCHLFPRTILNGRYLIGEVINNGGFGVVYKAYDIKLETVVAIKELLPTQNSIVNRMPGETEVIPVNEQKAAHFDDLKTRFLIEARTMAQFNSCESIVHVFDFFEENNTAYLVMEFIEGITLRKFIEDRNAPIPFEETMQIMFPIMQALSLVHKQKILHRDISLENIMLTPTGGVKLIDFGAAKLSETEVEKTLSVVLKPGYTPPEQYRSKAKIGPYTDVYSVGAVIYRMVTGVFPEESIDRVEKDNLARPSKLNINMPLYAEKSIMKAMAIRENARFKSMDEFMRAITGQKRADFPEKELKKKKVLRAVSVVAIFCVIIASVAATYIFKQSTVIVPTKDANLTIWYIKDDSEKDKRWENIKTDFETFYKAQNKNNKKNKDQNKELKIEIELKCFEADEYEKKLEKAITDGTAPDIYEAQTLTENKYAASLDSVYKQAKNKNFAPAFDVMKNTLKDNKEVAFGFDQTVLYVYTHELAKVPNATTTLESLEKDFETSKKIKTTLAISPDAVLTTASAYDKENDSKEVYNLFKKAEKIDGKEPIKVFHEGYAPYYIGMMSDFSKINEKVLAGTNWFDVCALTGTTKDHITFPETWSIYKDASSEDKKAAEFFMYFLLCEDAGQTDITEVNHNTYYLPLLSDTANSVCKGYGEYEFIYEEKAESKRTIKSVDYATAKEFGKDSREIAKLTEKKNVDEKQIEDILSKKANVKQEATEKTTKK